MPVVHTADQAGAVTPPDKGLSVVLLGTAAGPPPQAWRQGVSSALVVDGKTYVVDCGRGAVSQYMAAGLSMPSLTGIFLTHLHADHTVDCFSFPLLSAGVSGPQGFQSPIGIWGPGSSREPSRLTGSSDIVPGTAEMLRRANEVFAASTTFFLDEHFGSDPMALVEAHDILPPDGTTATRSNPAPAMQPFPVMEDDHVKVTAILVPHGPVFPALAYRFDTDHGSVVFSGDTTRTPNIITLAQGADLLLHEAANFAALPRLGYPEPVVDHIREVHTDIMDFGEIAAEADVKVMVATHLSPANPHVSPDQEWVALMRDSATRAGYRGEMVLGQDLMRIDV